MTQRRTLTPQAYAPKAVIDSPEEPVHHMYTVANHPALQDLPPRASSASYTGERKARKQQKAQKLPKGISTSPATFEIGRLPHPYTIITSRGAESLGLPDACEVEKALGESLRPGDLWIHIWGPGTESSTAGSSSKAAQLWYWSNSSPSWISTGMQDYAHHPEYGPHGIRLWINQKGSPEWAKQNRIRDQLNKLVPADEPMPLEGDLEEEIAVEAIMDDDTPLDTMEMEYEPWGANQTSLPRCR